MHPVQKSTWQCFATGPRGTERLLARELRSLGLPEVREARAGVSFAGGLTAAYRACLWSRLASRILYPLASVPATSSRDVYDGVRAIAWDEHLGVSSTLACDVTGSSAAITHTQYGAQLVKDAIVDQFRERHGRRPSVAVRRPDVRLALHLEHDRGSLAVDLASESLHRRGYREPGEQAAAPLKENLAAAVLLSADWPELAQRGAWLADPLCGSGTLLIEGAWMAADVAPGLLRPYWGFQRWEKHDAALWEQLVSEARARRARGLAELQAAQRDGRSLIFGDDRDPTALRLAMHNLRRAGLEGLVQVRRRDLKASLDPLPGYGRSRGLVVANPPYGERLTDARLSATYALLGRALRERFPEWEAAVLVADKRQARRLGLPAHGGVPLFNGPLHVLLLRGAVRGAVHPAIVETPPAASPAPAAVPLPGARPEAFGDLHAEDFANRLRRNLRTIGRPLRRAGITCFRLYDADLPDYNLALDLYEDWVHVQEYAAPKHIDPAKAAARLDAALAAIHQVLNVAADHVVLKVRRRQRGSEQYGILGSHGQFLTVHEGDAAFQINLTDRLDTGLFLDDRQIRRAIRELAARKRFLNLYGYTGTATVSAALGGARDSVTVDLSATYLDWARRNLLLNGLDPARHRMVRADCRTWLSEEARARRTYGLIFLAPPTFSNSAHTGAATLDIQRDHVALIRSASRLLAPDGTLLFATKRRGFVLDSSALADLRPVDLSRATLPPDFARRAHSHHVWRIERPRREDTPTP